MSRLWRAMHLVHQYQVLIAIIVASIVFTTAWFMRRSPVVDPQLPQVAAREPLIRRAVGVDTALTVTPRDR